MSNSVFSKQSYGGSGPESYENFFVPKIGRPLAEDLIDSASLESGDRTLDVGCGTAIVARLARKKVGNARLAALDPNPGMIGIGKKVANGLGIEWHQSSAELMPLEDEAFDIALSQMALQFVPDRAAAVREIARVLVPGGRVVINVVGPSPASMVQFADALATHISPEASKFVEAVFSLHDPQEIEALFKGAGLKEVLVDSSIKVLSLPQPEDFLWGYLQSTPLGGVVGEASEEAQKALNDDVVKRWQEFVEDGAFKMRLPVVVVTAKK